MNKSLYKKDKSGKIRIWSISIDGLCMDISYGVIGGELQHERHVVEHGKAGRTQKEQIDLQANSKINSKKNAGYVEKISEISDVIKNQLGLVRPMLASKVNYDKIDFKTAYIQRKYDGHRCLITKQAGQLVAYSRGGKPITSVDHILADIQLSEGQTLDGELYIHGLPLQAISSKVRKQNVTAEDLNYIAYDFISPENFPVRFNKIYEVVDPSSENVFIAPTVSVINEKDIVCTFNEFRKDNYEGAIVRHGKEGYEIGRRSKYLMKVKGFFDDEFEVVNILSSSEGWARLVCVTKKGKEFRVSAPGTHAEKRTVLVNKGDYIGKFVRVEFAAWTVDKKPSQPVATMFRDKENE